MSEIHPITGAVISSMNPAARAAEKTAQLRKKQQKRNATAGDSFETEIHAADEMEKVGDDNRRKRREEQSRREKPGRDSNEQKIDVRA